MIQELIKTLESNYWNDFTEVETKWSKAIEELCKQLFEENKSNVKYLTELVLVMNWKIREHYETDEDTARVYDKLWKELDEYCCENLKWEEARYYFKRTD